MRVLPAGAECGSVLEVGKMDPHPGAILASTVCSLQSTSPVWFPGGPRRRGVQLGSRAGWQPGGHSKCLFS